MPKIKITLKSHLTGEEIFEGHYENARQAVEDAVSQGVILDGVDVSHMNLACANLDDAQMAGARCHGTNFNGANLSEAVLDFADFTGAELSHACLAASSLNHVNFSEASFASTDVTDAVITRCQFTCPSVFTTLFCRAAHFKDCLYYCDKGHARQMNDVPIFIYGLPMEIVCLDNEIKIGRDFIAKKDIASAGLSHLKFLYGRKAAHFLIAGVFDERAVKIMNRV